MPIGQDLQANLCHACARRPESRGGGGEIAHTCLVLGEDISRNDWNSLQSSHGFMSGWLQVLRDSDFATTYDHWKCSSCNPCVWITMRSNPWRRGLHICKDREWTAFVLKGIPDTSPVLTLHLKHAEYMSEWYATIQGGLCCEKRDASHSIDHLASSQAKWTRFGQRTYQTFPM